jgi:hypothetical protein
MTVPTSPAPAGGPASPAGVVAWLQGAASEEDVAGVVAAVNMVVRRSLSPADDGSWAADHQLGATMLAGRLWRRRNSPAGVETFGGDVTAYVQRNDPDVAMLLQLGSYTPPAVG